MQQAYKQKDAMFQGKIRPHVQKNDILFYNTMWIAANTSTEKIVQVFKKL